MNMSKHDVYFALPLTAYKTKAAKIMTVKNCVFVELLDGQVKQYCTESL
jgi:hypothetical protein